MSGWVAVDVSGALADSEVTDFGAGVAANTALPSDSALCILIKYNSDAATAVRIFSAAAAGAAAEFQNEIYNSAFQTNPGADQTQYINDWPTQIIIVNRVPWTLRITKAASDAWLWWRSVTPMGPGC